MLISDAELIFVSFINQILLQNRSFVHSQMPNASIRSTYRLFDFERFAIELIEAGKHGRAALEAGVTVFFDG